MLDVRMRPAPCCVSCVFFITVLITLLNRGHTQDAQLTFEPNLANFFSGESVTFRCDMNEGAVTDWHYSFTQDGRQIASFSTNNLYSLNLMAHSSGTYQCIGHKNSEDFKKQSNNVTLSVSAHRPKATLTADSKSILIGSVVTLSCSVEGSAGWTYEWSIKSTSNSYEPLPGTENQISISQHGLYRCRGKRGKTPAFLTEDSEVLRLEKTLSNRASVTIQPTWTHIFSGEEIAVLCEIEGGGGDAEWKYEWRTDSSNTPPAHREYRISSASPFHSGQYWCKGRQDSYTSTEWSEAFQLTVSSRKPTAVVSGVTLVGGTLTCSVEDSTEWKYYWFRRSTVFSENEIIGDGGLDNAIAVSQGGIYHCRAGRGSQSFFTEDSHAVIIEKKVSEKPVVSLEPNWSLIFTGEKITVRCYIDGGAEWEYEWSKPDSNKCPARSECTISSAAVSHSGNYRCMGKHKSDWYSSTEWSEVIALTVSPHRPKANLSAEDGSFPVGGSVTLTCSVSPSSSGWEYFWYRGHKTSEPLMTQDAALRTSQISVSRGGLYWCRGGRGDPVYYTEFSDPVSVNAVATNRAVVTLQSSWPKIYSGEAVSLRCDIQGEEAEWEYEWATTSSNKPPNQKEYRIRSASQLNGGEYWCKGRLEGSQHGSTAWSSNFSLVVYNTGKPKPVLTVSPLWLSSGDSVTLNCKVEHPSAGWRFYWYKAVPTMSDSSYTYELLPGSSRGTEQGSYIVHGQTGTAGYVCRAGRGDPVYFTDYSQPEFVFSGDLHSEASLTLSPDRVQHFTSDPVSLHCGGNSTWWRVMRLMDNHSPSVCSQWGTVSGSTCSLGHWQSGAVYWCESESLEFSNAVNITAAVDIILVSPVHSVAEGEFVSLGCKLKTEQPLSNVTFYKNEKVIQSDDSARLNISAASKSDEGVYKCQHSGSVSSGSWLLVRSTSSHSPVPSIVGLVFGILLVLLLPLLLLFWYKKSKATCCHRPVQSQRTNQSSATVQNVHKDDNEQIYSLLHGDICIYDTINGSGITESGTCGDPADSCEYGNLDSDS